MNVPVHSPISDHLANTIPLVFVSQGLLRAREAPNRIPAPLHMRAWDHILTLNLQTKGPHARPSADRKDSIREGFVLGSGPS